MLTDLITNIILRLAPQGRGAQAWKAVAVPLRRLDRLLGELPQAAGLASTTFVLARKPPTPLA